jgi:hypothetical protein
MQSKSQLVDVMVPVYASYDVAKPFSIYVSPKYVARFTQSTDQGMTSSHIGQLVGGSGGVKLGDGMGLFLEASYLKDVTSSFHAIQVSGALFF